MVKNKNFLEKKYDWFDMAEAFAEGGLSALNGMQSLREHPHEVAEVMNAFETWLAKHEAKKP